MNHIIQLTDSDLEALATAMRTGRLNSPVAYVGIQKIIASSMAQSVANDLNSWSSNGYSTLQIAEILDVIIKDRHQREYVEKLVDFVTTGPEAGGVANRDTSVVVRELFSNAEKSVLVAGYAVYQGQQVFQSLADRMHEKTDLKVQLFLDIQRPPGEQAEPEVLVNKFRNRFRQSQWPRDRPLPRVYYFPRSLEVLPEKKACLHAKCVVVDNQQVFISSANFTEAAQERNIELGVLMRSEAIAKRVSNYFETLLAEKLLRQLV